MGAAEQQSIVRSGQEITMEIARMKTVILGGLALMPIAEQKERLENILTTEGNRTTINTPELRRLIQDCAALVSTPLAEEGSWFTNYFSETDGSSIIQQDEGTLAGFGIWLADLKEKIDQK